MGNEPGIIAAGGYTVVDEMLTWSEETGRNMERTLYAALADGIYKGWEEGSFRRICEDNASCLNLWEDRLYYINTFELDGKLYEEIVSVNTAGQDRKVHAGALPVEGKQIIEDKWDFGVNCTMRNGYTDLYLGENALFFIADDEKSGSMTISTPESRAICVRWDSGHSIYMLDLNTGVKYPLAENLGNGAARMSLRDMGGQFYMDYTVVYDAGQEDAVQTLKYALSGSGDPLNIQEWGLEGVLGEEVLGFSTEYIGVGYYIGRGTEGTDTLRIEDIYTEKADLPWDNMPGIAVPMIGMHNIYWICGERDDDIWEDVTLMRSHVDVEMQHDPIHILGDVPDGSEFSDFAILSHVSSVYLRTEDALYRVGMYGDTELTKLIDTSVK